VILLDSTVLVYAVGTEHPLRAPARLLLRAHGSRDIEATTTVEVLQEFLHVRSRRRPRSDAASLVSEFVDAFDVIRTSPADLVAGADLYSRQEGLGAFDAVLAAVALGIRANALVSADRAFAEIDDLPWIDLADPNLQTRLLGDSV
jgi:predicted nucleic acid-binding protein